MELKTPTPITTTTFTAPTTTTTTPETETETPPTKHLSKGFSSFTNGSYKLLPHSTHPPPPPQAVLVVYRECLKNHAATLGGHALDGCGEFMPSPTSTPTDPTSLKCAACGCHRNFHRRDPEETGTHLIEYHPHPSVPAQITPQQVRSPGSSVSPPPISSSYYPSAPQMLLALSTGGLSVKPENHHNGSGTVISPMGGSGRKRFRTKFSQEQKEKMYSFSERLGWKMQKRDEVLVEEFCNEVGVGKGVLKVWMHNNKHTFAKREVNGTNGGITTTTTTTNLLHTNPIITSITPNISNNINHNHHHHHNHGNSAHHQQVGTNCSSSSS